MTRRHSLCNGNFYHCTKKNIFQRKIFRNSCCKLEYFTSRVKLECIVMYFFFQMYAGYVLELSNFTCGYHCTEKCTCYELLGFIELAEKFGEFSRMKYDVCAWNCTGTSVYKYNTYSSYKFRIEINLE